MSPDAVGKETMDTQHIANTAELQDYLAGHGEWCPAADAPSSRPATAATGATAATASADVTKTAEQQCSSLGRLVAELAALAQKLKGHPSAAVPAVQQQEDNPAGKEKAMPTAAAVAAALQVDAAAQTIQSIPLKIAVVSAELPDILLAAFH